MRNSWILWLSCSSFRGNLHIGFYNECTDYHFHVQCTVFLFFFILTNTSWGVVIIILTPGYSLYSYPTPLKQISKHNTWTRIWKVEPSGRGLILFVFILNVYVGMYLGDVCVDVCILLRIWRQATTLWSCFSPLCGSWRWNSHSWVCLAKPFTQWAIWLPSRRCLDSDRSILMHELVHLVLDTKPGSLSSLFCPCSIPTPLNLQAKKAEVLH